MSTARVPFQAQIRTLSVGELDRVMEIERAAYPYPWTRTIFEDCIRVGYDCHGLFINSILCGYTVQTQAADESHLLNLCVDPDWQRRRYGQVLLQQAIRVARTRQCTSMFLEVRPSNAAGIALYQRSGFHIIGTRREYYRADEGREDAIVMRLELTEPKANATSRARGAAKRHDPF